MIAEILANATGGMVMLALIAAVALVAFGVTRLRR